MIAFPPALFFSDSWGYLFTAFTGHPVSLSYLRPNGYSVIVRLLTFPDATFNSSSPFSTSAGC